MVYVGQVNELYDSLPENQRAAPWAARRLEREYLWAADPGGYVDECVAQLVYTQAHAIGTGEQAGQEVGDDTTPTILYTLVDHTSSVAGLTDAAGRLVCQYSYTPYGELRASEYFDTQTQGATSTEAAEALAAARGNRLGHQGLFTVRFDRPWDGAMDMGTAVTSGTNATGPYRTVCHNRNRLYDPALGRFLENDPNGLGVPVLGDFASGGESLTASTIDPDFKRHFHDGMNAHVAYGSSPLSASDATGLDWDPFSMVDDFFASRTASTAALMNNIADGARSVAMVSATIASFLPFPGAAIAGELALAALEGRPLGPVLAQQALSLLPGGSLVLTIGSIATDLANIETQQHSDDVLDDETLQAAQEFIGGGNSGAGPAQAGMTSSAIHFALSNGLPLLSIFTQGLGGPADTHVYVGEDAHGNVVYVGMSNDVGRRRIEHGARFTYVRQITSQPLTRLQARAIETAAMTKFGSTGGTSIHAQFTGENTNRSISPRRARFFQAALSWGSQWLAQNYPSLH